MIDVAASPAIEVRPAWQQDQAFVASTMREQLCRRHGDQMGLPFHKADLIIDRILDSERTRVLIACEGKRIVGWLAYTEIPRVRAVFFAYVRKEHRGKGVARQLVDTAWPRKVGRWVHPGGINGGSTESVLKRFDVTAVDLEELL